MTIENQPTTDDVANLAAAVASLSESLDGDLPIGTRANIINNIDRLSAQIKQALSPPLFAPELFLQANLAQMATITLSSAPPLDIFASAPVWSPPGTDHRSPQATCPAGTCVSGRASFRLYGKYGHVVGPIGLATQRRLEAKPESKIACGCGGSPTAFEHDYGKHAICRAPGGGRDRCNYHEFGSK